MTAIELAKARLDNVVNFSQSDLRVFIEQMVAKDTDYFTEEKTNEINEYLDGSGWKFHGKLPTEEKPSKNAMFHFVPFGNKREYYFQNGLFAYYVGKAFDIDDDIKRFQKDYEYEIEYERKRQEEIKAAREFWRKKITELSQDELVEILVDFDTRDME